MTLYKFTFKIEACYKGALGKPSKMTSSNFAQNEEEARAKLYDTLDHVRVLSVKKACVKP